MPCRATQNRRVIAERSDRMWSTGEVNGKPLQYTCLENPMNIMKRLKHSTLKDEFPRSVGAQYATGDQWKNNWRKNEGMEPKQKQHPVVDVTGDRSNVCCYKKQFCIGSGRLGPWIKQIGSGQTGDVKSECWYSRNQWTKMNWNGWI